MTSDAVCAALQTQSVTDGIQAAIDNAGVLPAREVGLESVNEVCGEFGIKAHPYLVQLLPSILTAYADKVRFLPHILLPGLILTS